MSVELQPQHTLGFHRPLTQLVKRTLTIANPQKTPVAFKVKTTAPKQYCVRPNSGRIEPGERVEVQVLLQPMREDPAPDTKCRDKFLVQSAAITADRESLGLTEMWAALESEARADKASSQIQEQKIRCAYLPPVEGAEANGEESAPAYEGIAGAANGASSPDHPELSHDASPEASTIDQRDSTFGTPARGSTLSTGGNAYSTPQPSTLSNGNATSDHVKPLSQIASESTQKPVQETLNEARSTISAQTVAAGAAIAATASAATAAVASKLPSSGASSSQVPPETDGESSVVAALRKQLASSQAEVELLKTQLKDGNGLRQRTTAINKPAHDPSLQLAQSLKAAQSPGLPIETVAAIVFGVFVFTWLFL